VALRKFDIGTIVTLAISIITGIFYLGIIHAKVESINTDKLDKKIKEALIKIQNAEKNITDQLPVGTVIASVLEPKIFLSEGRNKKWHLADNSAIPIDTKYKKLVKNASIQDHDRLPDFRGMFLRGLNVGRDDGKEDPDGSKRIAGSYQEDQYKSSPDASIIS
jgi:hypothetical protein